MPRGYAAIALILGLGLAGCADHAREAQQQTQQLAHELTGRYDTRQRAVSPSIAAPALALVIDPIQAPLLGETAFYVRETMADDPRRVLAQRIWRFDPTKDGTILQTSFVFKEPRRWLNIMANPELLESLLPDDVTVLSGCYLYWHKTPSGFEGTDKDGACDPGEDAESTLIEQHAELHGTELVITQRQIGPDGRSTTEQLLFRRRSGSSQPPVTQRH